MKYKDALEIVFWTIILAVMFIIVAGAIGGGVALFRALNGW